MLDAETTDWISHRTTCFHAEATYLMRPSATCCSRRDYGLGEHPGYLVFMRSVQPASALEVPECHENLTVCISTELPGPQAEATRLMSRRIPGVSPRIPTDMKKTSHAAVSRTYSRAASTSGVHEGSEGCQRCLVCFGLHGSQQESQEHDDKHTESRHNRLNRNGFSHSL